MRVVAQNSEATLAFREMAANVMRLVAGDQDVDLAESVLRFATVLEPQGGPLELVDFTPRPDQPNRATNMIIRGVLRMVASTLVTMDTEDDEYQVGLSELSRGVLELNRELQRERVAR